MNRLKNFLTDTAVSLSRVALRYPVETLLSLYAYVLFSLGMEEVLVDPPRAVIYIPLLTFAAALVANTLTRCHPRWRILYFVLLLLPAASWAMGDAWFSTNPFYITLGVLAPLAILLARRALGNREFTRDALTYLQAAVVGGFLAWAALLAFLAIFHSVIYIFGIWQGAADHISVYALWFALLVLWPLLALVLLDRFAGDELRGSKIGDALLNYILAPALLIYTAILYLYCLQILFSWTLPKGGVAYLVFGFTMTVLAVKALGQLLEKRIYDWFFDRFSLVSLPVLALFWIGVVRRTNEYGLTEPRVYLVVCGGLMTLCVLLFLSQRTGRYLWVCLAAWVSFAALAYVPFLEPERIAVQSQTQRAERVAERLGRLGGDGRLLLTPMPLADTVYKKEYRKLYESLDYIRRDSAAFARFGVKDLDDLAAIFPEAMRDYVRWGYDWSCVDTCVDTNIIELEAPVNVRFEVNAEYPHYYTNLRNWYNDHSYDVSNDTLRLFLGEECAVYRISCRDLLERQLERSGFDPAEACEPAPEQLLRLLDYRDDRCRILFENIKLERTDSAVVIQGMAINAVLMR